MLKDLLSSDPVLQVLILKLIDEIQGPVSTPASASYMLEGIYGIMQLLHEAEFVAEMFDVTKLLECDQDQINYACRSLYEKLIPFTGKAKIEDQESTAIADMTKKYHTRMVAVYFSGIRDRARRLDRYSANVARAQ